MNKYLKDSISNGMPREQALIRAWWHEVQGAKGRLVWEYYLDGYYADAVFFPDATELTGEYPGQATGKRFPLHGQRVIVCEAKKSLGPELVGQAIVYTALARKAGADVVATVVHCEVAPESLLDACRLLDFELFVRPFDPLP